MSDFRTGTTVRATPRRRAARLLTALATVPTALAVSALPAQGVPTEGDPPAATTTPAEGRWGCPGVDGPAFPGQRYGCALRPEQRGPVLE